MNKLIKSMIFVVILTIVQYIPVHAKPEFEKFMDVITPLALSAATVIYAIDFLLPKVDTPKETKPSLDIQNTIAPETKKAICDLVGTTFKVAVATDLPFKIATEILVVYAKK